MCRLPPRAEHVLSSSVSVYTVLIHTKYKCIYTYVCIHYQLEVWTHFLMQWFFFHVNDFSHGISRPGPKQWMNEMHMVVCRKRKGVTKFKKHHILFIFFFKLVILHIKHLELFNSVVFATQFHTYSSYIWCKDKGKPLHGKVYPYFWLVVYIHMY